MRDDDRERFSKINRGVRDISESISIILQEGPSWGPPKLMEKLVENVVETVKEVREIEPNLIAQKNITREELYNIGKVHGRMEGIYRIIMKTMDKKRN